jgi:aryl-alcohol dehydrogenase-like predicted oxidoreductase
MPWSSQARGFFSGKFTPDKRDDQHMVEIYYNDENFERLDRAQLLGQEKRSSAIQISLAYVMQQPFPIFPIIGPRNLDELNSSLGAKDVELTEKEMQWLNLEIEEL